MRLLVTRSECGVYLSVSVFGTDEVFNRYIREAQMFDLKPLMCEGVYEDIMSASPVGDYALLLSGGSYEHEGQRYEFAGLGAVIAYFAYARYIFTGHQVDTAYGVVRKVYNDAEVVSREERRDLRGLYMQQAQALWMDCERYMRAVGLCGADDKGVRRRTIRMKLI